MELSTLTQKLSAFIIDDTNVINTNIWNVDILKNPITTETWICVKGILDGIFMYHTKAKVLDFDLMKVPTVDKKLYAIKKYLDINWTEFVHEEKGVYAHNLFMEFLMCFYTRTLTFQRDIFPTYHGSAMEHDSYEETLKIDEILDLAFKQIIATCPDKIRLSGHLRLEQFQCKQYSPMMTDGNSYYFVLGLIAAQIASKLKDNFLSKNTHLITNTSGYMPRGNQLEYSGTDPIRLSELEVSKILGSHGDEVSNLEFILEYLSIESKFTEEHIELFFDDPLSFYFDSVNNFQINLIQKIAKNDVFKDSTKKVQDSSAKSKQAWARRPYVQQLLVEDIQAKILDELDAEASCTEFNDHEEIIEYFDRLVTPAGLKLFINNTKNEVRTNAKLSDSVSNLSNLTLVTTESYKQMFTMMKELYLTNYNEFKNSEETSCDISDVVTKALDGITTNDSFNQKNIVVDNKAFTAFDTKFFEGSYSEDERKFNFVREALNKTVFYLNKAAFVASETNPNNLLATLISLILFPHKFSNDGAIFAKSKISIFQSNNGILEVGDLEIRVTDKVRIFLRNAGNKIKIVYVGNPTYH